MTIGKTNNKHGTTPGHSDFSLKPVTTENLSKRLIVTSQLTFYRPTTKTKIVFTRRNLIYRFWVGELVLCVLASNLNDGKPPKLSAINLKSCFRVVHGFYGLKIKGKY